MVDKKLMTYFVWHKSAIIAQNVYILIELWPVVDPRYMSDDMILNCFLYNHPNSYVGVKMLTQCMCETMAYFQNISAL